MWLKIFLTFFLAFNAQGASINCNYSWIRVDELRYACNATFDNPNGFDNFTSISGDHLEGMTNSDVTYFITSTGSMGIIPRIICTQFSNLEALQLDNARVENISNQPFNECRELLYIRLANSNIPQLPENIFSENQRMVILQLENVNLTSLSENIFSNLKNLRYLYLHHNPLESLPANIFRSLISLNTLRLDGCRLSTINHMWFHNLSNLSYLYLHDNNISTIDEFPELANLANIYLQGNQIAEIQSGTFRWLSNLLLLDLSRNLLKDLSPTTFDGLSTLSSLQLSFNHIEDLPAGIFTSLTNLASINLSGNQIKTLNRHYFGSLTALRHLGLDENVVNAFERSIFDEAQNLENLNFWNNVCASGSFVNIQNRTLVSQRMQRCFRNHQFIVEATTEGTNFYRLFTFPTPGIIVRVNVPQDAHISLNPVNFEAVPRIEILIGIHNNTRSVIRRNGSEDVVDISTPNILNANSWTGIRIVFANFVVMVIMDGAPIMAYNMQEFYPMNFYGIRTPGNIAPWYIQPVDTP